MITKELLKEMLGKSFEDGFEYGANNLLNDDVDCDEYAFEMGRYLGREEVLADLLALLDNANITKSNEG